MAEDKDFIDTQETEQTAEEIQNVEENKEVDVNMKNVVHVGSIFENYFLDYASYVNLNRAIPEVIDGLKPVQRRILHSMDELEDGRYNKVANIIGNTMKYHPHGDASFCLGISSIERCRCEFYIACIMSEDLANSSSKYRITVIHIRCDIHYIYHAVCIKHDRE